MNIYMKDDGEEGIIDDNGRMISFEDLAKASRLFEMLKISDGKYCDNCRMLFGIQCYLFRKDGYVPSGESCLEDIESELKEYEDFFIRAGECVIASMTGYSEAYEPTVPRENVIALEKFIENHKGVKLPEPELRTIKGH